MDSGHHQEEISDFRTDNSYCTVILTVVSAMSQDLDRLSVIVTVLFQQCLKTCHTCCDFPFIVLAVSQDADRLAVIVTNLLEF